MGKFELYCKDCGCLMKRRKGRFGEFFGCTGYPICRSTMTTRDAALEEILPDRRKDRWED